MLQPYPKVGDGQQSLGQQSVAVRERMTVIGVKLAWERVGHNDGDMVLLQPIDDRLSPCVERRLCRRRSYVR